MKNINSDFVDYFASYDKDYREYKYVHSLYDKDSPNVYIITGNDTKKVVDFAKPVGREKGQSKDWFGHTKSYESKLEARNYFANVKNFLKTSCSQITNIDKKPVTLTAYFDTLYNKKGEIKGYKFSGAKFVTETDNNPQMQPDLTMLPEQGRYRQMNIYDFIQYNPYYYNH